MAFEPPFAGYAGTVWATCYQALAWLNGLLATSNKVADIANPAELVFRLLRDAAVSIDAWQTGAALTIEVQNLAAIRALPLFLDTNTQTYFDARINAVTLAAAQITALPPVFDPFGIIVALRTGTTNVQNPLYLEWCLGFSGEVPPFGLTADTLLPFAAAEANAWLTVANAISVLQGTNPTRAYDTAARMYRASAAVSNTLAQMQILPASMHNTSGVLVDNNGNAIVDSNGNSLIGAISILSPLIWNNLVALPTILLDASAIATSPATLPTQQAMTIRFALNQTAVALAVFLRSLKTSVGAAPITAILNNTDTLMDQAARETGNFETWVDIARLNNITPPYPGPSNQSIAQSGRILYMPGSDVTLGANQTPPVYPDSVMGVDYYFGPINGIQPVWNGDLALIRGLLNFAQALGRRLQTPLGSLVYHQEYGSRIPAEVGSVQSADEAARLAAFGRAALAADARTGRILSVRATTEPGLLATFTGVVVPIGPGSTPVTTAVNIPAGA